MTTSDGGNVPRKVSRWANVKRYACTHENCPNEAVILFASNAHNCCNNHEHYDMTGEVQ